MVLIKNSFVIDGTGSPGEKKDILLKDDRIVAVGDLGSKTADVVIDGSNYIAVPGFIDINTDSDHYLSLFTDPLQQDFLKQGVTTIIGGHCGSSLAPLIQGTLESIRKWGDINQVNVNWNTLAEFLTLLEKRKLGVNFGTLVGHSTIRRSILGGGSGDLTERQLLTLASVIDQALSDGAFGLSTGLGYNHARQTSVQEIKALLSVVAKRKGVYTTHIRSEKEGIVDAVAETVSVARLRNVPTVISHFRALKGFEEQFSVARDLIEETNGLVRFDSYPFDYSMLPIYTLLPEWAQVGTIESMMSALASDYHPEDIEKALPQLTGEELIVARAPGFDYLVGKSLAEYARSQNMTVPVALITLMKVTRLRAVLFYRNINLSLTLEALTSDAAFVASNSPSLIEGKNVIENERAVKTFSTFLNFIRTSERSLEWAVRKITAEPAEFLRLKGRGVIKEGNVADLALLPAEGDFGQAAHVFVSGAHVVRDGAIREVYNGRILRRSS